MTLEKVIQFGIEEGLPDEKGRAGAGKIADDFRQQVGKQYNPDSLRRAGKIVFWTMYATAVLW